MTAPTLSTIHSCTLQQWREGDTENGFLLPWTTVTPLQSCCRFVCEEDRKICLCVKLDCGYYSLLGFTSKETNRVTDMQVLLCSLLQSGPRVTMWLTGRSRWLQEKWGGHGIGRTAAHSPWVVRPAASGGPESPFPGNSG